VNIEEQLQETFDSLVGPVPDKGASRAYENFLARYRSKSPDVHHAKALDDQAASVKLGYAAYFVGVHLISCERESEAEDWLRIAADRDIGDAAFRLARLYETQAVKTFNVASFNMDQAAEKEIDEKFSEAHYWYRLAANAGYSVADHPAQLEPPSTSLDCCASMRALQKEELADAILASAREQHLAVLREQRSDSARILEQTRDELKTLALRHQKLYQQIIEFEDALGALNRLAHRPFYAFFQVMYLVVMGWFSKSVRNSLSRVAALYEITTEQATAARPATPSSIKKRHAAIGTLLKNFRVATNSTTSASFVPSGRHEPVDRCGASTVDVHKTGKTRRRSGNEGGENSVSRPGHKFHRTQVGDRK
jgi:TPR repeat protein